MKVKQENYKIKINKEKLLDIVEETTGCDSYINDSCEVTNKDIVDTIILRKKEWLKNE